MYLNGELSVIDSLGFDNSSTLILIGHHPSGRNFDDLVDDIRFGEDRSHLMKLENCGVMEWEILDQDNI